MEKNDGMSLLNWWMDPPNRVSYVHAIDSSSIASSEKLFDPHGVCKMESWIISHFVTKLTLSPPVLADSVYYLEVETVILLLSMIHLKMGKKMYYTKYPSTYSSSSTTTMLVIRVPCCVALTNLARHQRDRQISPGGIQKKVLHHYTQVLHSSGSIERQDTSV